MCAMDRLRYPQGEPDPRQDSRMVEAEGTGSELAPEHASALLAATGRGELVDALHWIAEGRPVSGVASAGILTAVVAAADLGIRGADAALRTAVRSALRSTLDTSADLVLTDSIVPPHRYQAALANVARRTPSGTMSGITSAAVMAAQASDPLVMETLGLVAGLSWRDLQARSTAHGIPLPSDPEGTWNPSQVLGAFRVIDDIVRGQVEPQLVGAVPARPLELLPQTTPTEDHRSIRSCGPKHGNSRLTGRADPSLP